jgi:cell division protein FtsN
MSRVDAAAPIDRLPWLDDEPAMQPRRSRRTNVAAWAGGIMLAVAAAGFWLGSRSVRQEVQPPVRKGQVTTTVRLPEARPAAPEVRVAPQREVRLEPLPQVRPEARREVHIATPRSEKPSTESAAPSSGQERSAAATPTPVVRPAPPAAAQQPFVMPKPWPPRVIHGAAGRLVQIGAFGSTHQAKRGWWFMVRAYPAMAHLPAVVRPTRNSHGRVFYRFQVGTTSQAHSEVLCQRMLKIGFSCAVVGLPWKAKVER